MNSPNLFQDNKLVELYNDQEVNRISGFTAALSSLNPRGLADLYIDLCSTAPHRHQRKKRYLVGHTGITSTGNASNRREEHLAVALYNEFSIRSPMALPDSRSLGIIDYQTPLKANQADKGIGKVDLLGVIDENQLCIIELKVPATGGGCSDTPLRAYLEALAYCAIVESNLGDIANEVKEALELKISNNRPVLCIMAPDNYWLAYLKHKKTGEWWPLLDELAKELSTIMDLESHFIALGDAKFEMGLDGNPPRLMGSCLPVSVESLVHDSDSASFDDAI